VDSSNTRLVTRRGSDGITEMSGFAEVASDLMALTTTRPDTPRAGIVLCPSLFTEALRNYRRETMIARSLASVGIAVQRPQYRGTGNSDDTDFQRDSIVADVTVATELLEPMLGGGRLCFGGTRFGGLVAATVASTRPGAPVVLIEPVTDAVRFFDEGLRGKVLAAFQSGSGRRTKAQLLEELEQLGEIDVLGHRLDWSLYSTGAGWLLEDQLRGDPRPILLVQLGTEDPVRPEYEALAERWRSDGSQVDIVQLGSKRTWWFLHEQLEEGRKIRNKELAEADDLLAQLTSWLDSVTATEASR
jgi:Alpha/beta hydrolase family